MPENPDDLMDEITATDMDVMLTQSLESGRGTAHALTAGRWL